ncbi:hypothetical protein [Peribacillus simplex]|nr:hypothetical protein [Peribacillus simplex]MEC1397721.1 hypothetical protein [Peribacillus simplex]MED3910866.1 hypothetical protein [Peribacillus simplex]MED3985740.1 hypothetical protein [Peribacillus simplex]MED4096983.1 hypothetical protein [Peribacillus simplex]
MRNKSTIKIIATGGTIAGAGTSSTMTTGFLLHINLPIFGRILSSD